MANQLSISMTNLKNLLTMVSADTVVCIRGRHAVGKSESVAQAAEQLGLPLVMRRLSQMTEGDLLGLPEMVHMQSGAAATSFRPCEWLVEACEKPVVLFLDERNRALDAVKQAVFELCDSRGFYGYKLHPDTRVIIAENVGDNYQVQACDPAEVSRAVTVELDPSVKEWVDYAKSKNVNEMVIDFIRSNEKSLEFVSKNYEPNKKYPDRRSWFKFAMEADKHGLFDEPSNPMFYILAGGFLGVETAQPFTDFCKTYNKQVSIEDILSNWEGAKAKITGKKAGAVISNEKYIELGTKMSEYIENSGKKKQKIDLTKDKKAIENLYAFFLDVPSEVALQICSNIQSNQKVLSEIFKNPDFKNKILATLKGT